MFKKIKSFFKGVSSKAKSAYENTEAVIKAKVIRTVNKTESEIEVTLTCYELVPSDIN